MVKQLLFAHSIPGHPRPLGRPHLTWMDTTMHDMGSLGRMLQIDLPRDWANLVLYRDVWRGVVSRWSAGGQPVVSRVLSSVLFIFSSFPLRSLLGA